MSKEHWNGGNGGKGSKPRPIAVPQEEFDNRWDLIFKKKEKSDESKRLPDGDQEATDI